MAKVWVPHTTNDRPVPRSVWVDVMRFNGRVDYALPAAGWNWDRNLLSPYWAGPSNDGIAAFRICEYQPEAA